MNTFMLNEACRMGTATSRNPCQKAFEETSRPTWVFQVHSYARPEETRSRPISSTLVVDNFGLKYTHQEDIEHLIKCIKKKYKLTMDLDGNLYCSICMKWDYNARNLDIFMPGNILKQLQQYKHATPTTVLVGA